MQSSCISGVTIDRSRLDDFRPVPFAELDWPSISECFLLSKSGSKTHRDDLAIAFSPTESRAKVEAYVRLPLESLKQKAFFASKEEKRQAGEIKRFKKSLNLVPDSQRIRALAYRPFDRRYIYNDDAIVSRGAPNLQEAWGTDNICLYAMPSGTGAGPAVWAHGLLPDYHSFRGSFGGYAFPLWDRRPGQHPANLRPRLLDSLGAAYDAPVDPQQVFDAILCLLSARSYTARFAEDLADAFPHVPFPAEPTVLAAAAELGARIRGIETWSLPPSPEFATAQVRTVPKLAVGTSRTRVLAGAGGMLSFTLCDDGSGVVGPIAEAVWEFEVSGYKLLQKFLSHREGQAIDAAFLMELLDIIARVGALISLMEQADDFLERALAHPFVWENMPVDPSAAHAITRIIT